MQSAKTLNHGIPRAQIQMISVVAAVIMPKDSMIEGVNDSKKVSEKKREKLYDQILEEAISYGVGIIGQDEIDTINILKLLWIIEIKYLV